MKIAYFDTIAGISGDMTLGAFISAGISVDELSNELKKLKIKGIEIEAAHTVRHGIAAVKVDVITSETYLVHRTLHDIVGIIEASELNFEVKETAKRIFFILATAEAKVHGKAIEKIHFHEVGALDSIVDIVGTAICLDQFGIDTVYSTPVKLGAGGIIDTAHGKLALPGPATLEILKGYPTVIMDIPLELTTPTGAAIVKALSSGILSEEQLYVTSVGYGAGSRENDGLPNLFRIVIGETVPGFTASTVVLVEANIDDMNPEIYPYVIEKFLSHGAKDAYLAPIIMKKGRPGIVLSVLTEKSRLDDITHIFFSETSTIGIRISELSRRMLDRSQMEISTSFGIVKVKKITTNSRSRFLSEYEECKRIASERNIPLIDVYRILESELSTKYPHP